MRECIYCGYKFTFFEKIFSWKSKKHIENCKCDRQKRIDAIINKHKASLYDSHKSSLHRQYSRPLPPKPVPVYDTYHHNDSIVDDIVTLTALHVAIDAADSNIHESTPDFGGGSFGGAGASSSWDSDSSSSSSYDSGSSSGGGCD